MQSRIVRDFLPGSSDIDWCETNYVKSKYIAEYYNTVSNVIYLVMPPLLIIGCGHTRVDVSLVLRSQTLAGKGEPSKLSNMAQSGPCFLFRPYARNVGGGIIAVWILLEVVGLGSIYFHSTLSFAGQLIDELAIAWVILAGFAIWTPSHLLARWPFYGNRKKLGQFAAFLGVLVIFLALVKPILNAFILMTVSILATVLLCVEMKACTDRRAWRLCYMMLLWMVVAVTVWLSDRINCNLWLSIGFPYLHSLWHIFAFLASSIGCVLCAYLHASREVPHLNPQIHYWPSNHFEHGVPFVYIKSPMTDRYSS